MSENLFEALRAGLSDLSPHHRVGRVSAVDGGVIWVTGLDQVTAIGDQLRLQRRDGSVTRAEAIAMRDGALAVLSEDGPAGVSQGDRVTHLGPLRLRPSQHWKGRILDPYGRPLDGRPLMTGATRAALRNTPPPPALRRPIGARLTTGVAAMDTFLPLVTGQRVGLFAGSGVGKSRLLAQLAAQVQADICVLALVGERGRELRAFVDDTLGPKGMAKSVVVTATSDRSAMERKRCLHTAMATAEHFRNAGQHVLLLVDSVTRFAEAHREVAVSAGELPTLRGFPASVAHEIMALCERAGPGSGDMGDITAVFSVLVAGSDMEEPIADILRGVLDGHIVLDRSIAERGRFPAIDVLRSVSRSLPEAATEAENDVLLSARSLISAYEAAEPMIQAGLYQPGRDAHLDQAVAAWPEIETFLSNPAALGPDAAFDRLRLILRRSARPAPHKGQTRSSPAG